MSSDVSHDDLLVIPVDSIRQVQHAPRSVIGCAADPPRNIGISELTVDPAFDVAGSVAEMPPDSETRRSVVMLVELGVVEQRFQAVWTYDVCHGRWGFDDHGFLLCQAAWVRAACGAVCVSLIMAR
jgi:hypothetical protein